MTIKDVKAYFNLDVRTDFDAVRDLVALDSWRLQPSRKEASLGQNPPANVLSAFL